MSPSWSTLSCVLLVLAILLGAALAKSLPAAVYLLSFWHYALYWLAFAFGASDFDVFKRNAMAMKTVSVTALAFVYLSAPIDLVSLAVILGGVLLNLRAAQLLGLDRTHEVAGLPGCATPSSALAARSRAPRSCRPRASPTRCTICWPIRPWWRPTAAAPTSRSG